MQHRPHIALVIETSSIYGQSILRGIADYIKTHEPWSVYLDQRDLFAAPPAWLHDWPGDGVILRTRDITPNILNPRIPVIDLCDMIPPQPNCPRIESDHEHIGRLAGEHFIERGFERFAFCGFADHRWSALRLAGFRAAVRSIAPTIAIHEGQWREPGSRSWEREQQRLARWLTNLPKPIAIMAANDLRGQHLLDAATRAQLAVPEEVAIIGCDNDELLCSLCEPALSSVRPDPLTIGCRAAEHLDHLLQGGRPLPAPLFIAPLDIITRASSDAFAIEDRLVAEALRIIRQRACAGLIVDELIGLLNTSRTTIERRFREHLGRTPHEQIRHTQLTRVQELLAESDLPLDRIAPLAGFTHPEYMSVVFKRTLGVTPGRYRRTSRHADPPASRSR